VVYGGATEARSCTGCGCSASFTCSGVTVYACAGCSGPSANVPGGGVCSPLGSLLCSGDSSTTLRSVRVDDPSPSCSASGGSEMGSVSPANAYTICCST
jgi:hypothetical protein